MRTTLSIDDDVLAAVKALAFQQHKSVGGVISALTRQALLPPVTHSNNMRNGIPLLPMRTGATPVTPELVNQLRDELP
ncbi:CopG family transcriptional regulator [Crenothrix polyspora]|uniref:Putative antitoxin VapB38 n=1 Tax=Crenothrix polyspora TaxID=360316 RepID=A0A1R4H2V1_9GAMM|nr:CopG family transcriptional regulator [Crenothrix polyspora]SJM90515.1 putative antitoxin VapB38 [Crenothrix polyspora]